MGFAVPLHAVLTAPLHIRGLSSHLGDQERDGADRGQRDRDVPQGRLPKLGFRPSATSTPEGLDALQAAPPYVPLFLEETHLP
jgi:hypothetical protein